MFGNICAELEDKQLEEKTNADCLIKEQEKVHLGIKVGANITVTGVPGQEGAEGNVAEKKKVKEYVKANLGKLLKYNAWSTRWSPIRGIAATKAAEIDVVAYSGRQFATECDMLWCGFKALKE
ncbi:hypothetical protein Tco_0093127 [Tanacetum coccineum]